MQVLVRCDGIEGVSDVLNLSSILNFQKLVKVCA